MTTILLEKIDTLATFDEQRRVIKNGWVLIRDDAIEAIGAAGSEPAVADRRIDLSGHVVLPGLVNTHHHMFQSLMRNVPLLQDVSLFKWLGVMFQLMSVVTDEDLYVASLTNHAELLLSGCTTTVDHSYLKVNDMKFDTSIQAAQEMGIRFISPAAALPKGRAKGVFRLTTWWRTKTKSWPIRSGSSSAITIPGRGPWSAWSMRRVRRLQWVPASCAKAWRWPADMASATTRTWPKAPTTTQYMRHLYGKSSVYMAEEWGWVGDDIWYAHATVLSDDEIDLLARTGTAVAHCPDSNMYTAAGCCRVPHLLQKGVTVGLGVDGSAANNASNLLAEVRNALLLQRMYFGADALSPTQALELAILGSARLLRRDDIGVIAPGMAADIIAVNLHKIAFAGGLHDPVAAWSSAPRARWIWSIVNGRIRVEAGQLVGVDLPALVKRQNALAADLVRRAESGHSDLSAPRSGDAPFRTMIANERRSRYQRDGGARRWERCLP